MTVPSDANVDFLICDGVRPAADGKIDIAGFYPTREVRLDPAATLPVTVNLTFVFVLKDGDGQFSAIFRIADPLGKELHKFEVNAFTKPPGVAHVMMLPVGLIPIAHSGNYAVSLEVGGQRYRRSVRIYQ
jgi:hypothetical protein